MFSFDFKTQHLFKSPLTHQKSGLTRILALIGLAFLFLVGQVQSQVIENSEPLDSRELDIFLTAEVVPEIQYVRTQLIYILRVYSRENIECGRFYEPNHEPFGCEQSSELNIDHADVQKLDEVRHFTAQYQDSVYKIREQRYALFPENSGLLEIPPITFRGSICEGTCNAIFNPPKKIEKYFPSRQLNIQPKPLEFPDDAWWLPTQDFTLNEAWHLNSSHFRLDEPVTLTLTLQAKGVRAAQLPKLRLPPHLEGIHFYPASPQFKEHFEGDWLISEKQQQIDFIPKKPGQYTLPDITIPWWDSVNQQLRYAKIPAHSIHVLALNDKKGQTEKEFPIDMTHTDLWFWVSIALVVVWLMTLVVWWRQGQQRPVSTLQTDLRQKRQTLRAARQTLKRACEQNTPQQTKQALLDWATIRWQDMPMHNLVDIAEQLRDTQAKAKLRELDRVLYAAQEVIWEGKVFWRVISKSMDKISTGKVDVSPLPTLYPEN